MFGRRPTATRTCDAGIRSVPAGALDVTASPSSATTVVSVRTTTAELVEAPTDHVDAVDVELTEDPVGRLDDRDPTAEVGIGGAQLDADVPATDHDEVVGHAGQGQRAGGIEDPHLVDRKGRQLGGTRAGRDDRLAELQVLDVVLGLDGDPVSTDETTRAVQSPRRRAAACRLHRGDARRRPPIQRCPAARSTPTSPTSPVPAAARLRARWRSWAKVISAFDGMHPMFKQVPPSCSASTSTTSRPSWSARAAAV